MGTKEVKLPTTPRGWAIHLSRLVRQVHDAHGLNRFPIKVADIARDYSRNVYPHAPVSIVQGEKLPKQFEGALVPRPDGSGEWGIFYNSAISSPGRINFTLGHELGHYLLHRHLSGDPIYCAKRDMWSWGSEYGKMEAEANQFASYLLMPLDDFRLQVDGLYRPSVFDFELIRGRYDVSLTAAVLKWLEITPKRAMIVVSRDGFIDWSRSSNPLLKSGVFFRAKQEVIALPEGSLAGRQCTSERASRGEMLAAGVWAANEDVFESAIYSDYHDMAISLLIYPNDPPHRVGWSAREHDEPELVDVVDRMRSREGKHTAN